MNSIKHIVLLFLTGALFSPLAISDQGQCKLDGHPITINSFPVYRRSIHLGINEIWRHIFKKENTDTYLFSPANSYCDEYLDIIHYKHHLAWVPPHWQHELVKNLGYIPLLKTNSNLSIVILSPKSSTLDSLDQLKEKRLVMPAFTSTTSYIFIRHMEDNFPKNLATLTLTETDWGDEPILKLLKGHAEVAITSKSIFDRVASKIKEKLNAIEINSEFPKTVLVAAPCTPTKIRDKYVQEHKILLSNAEAVAIYAKFDIEDLREFTKKEEQALSAASLPTPSIALQCP